MKKIIIAAGGTGGHVFPAMCVADELMEKFAICFATDKRGFKYLGRYQHNAIIQPVILKNRLLLYVSLIWGIAKALWRLVLDRPQYVIGFGGYPSVPFVFAAQILRIKTIIHEQNAVLGKANKLLAKMVNLVILSFPIKTPSLRNSKIIGNPTRFEALYSGYQYQPSNKPHLKILILGGSQGSKLITEQTIRCILALPEGIRTNLFIHHQVRQEYYELVTSQYKKNQISAEVQTFFSNIGYIYQNTDLIIARSGASTVFEIIGFKIPAILIPFQASINGDQRANAEVLSQHGAALVYKEDNFAEITTFIKKVYNDRSILDRMSKSYNKLHLKGITKQIANCIFNL